MPENSTEVLMRIEDVIAVERRNGETAGMVLMKETIGGRPLNVFVDLETAKAIKRTLEHILPLTPLEAYDAWQASLIAADVLIEKIVLVQFEETLSAEVWQDRLGTLRRVDMDYGNAIAMAVRFDADIYARKEVLISYAEDAEKFRRAKLLENLDVKGPVQ